MIETDRVYRRNENFVFRRIEGETILVPIRANVGDLECIYSLNALGALVWERLDGKTGTQAIKRAITDAYDVHAAEAEADLLTFLREMESIDAVVAAGR
jgi:hypothetical protein